MNRQEESAQFTVHVFSFVFLEITLFRKLVLQGAFFGDTMELSCVKILVTASVRVSQPVKSYSGHIIFAFHTGKLNLCPLCRLLNG